MNKFSFGLLILLLAARPTTAVTISGQSRLVEALTGVSGGIGSGDLESTADPGPWDESVAAFLSGDDGFGAGAASQASNIASSEITMSGAVSASAATNPLSSSVFAGNGKSALTTEFSVASDTPYVSMLATNGDTEFEFSLVQTGGGAYGANSSGILTPATYTLQLIFRADAISDEAVSGGYSYSLVFIPEPSSVFLILTGGLLLLATRLTNRR